MKGTHIAKFCKTHKPSDLYVDILNKECTYENCTLRPSYGKKGTKKALFCKIHIPDDSYVDVVHKTCKYCDSIPVFGEKGTKIGIYCKLHIPDTSYVNVKDKTCIIDGCTIRPNFGQIGTKVGLYCKSHIPDENYINVNGKQCVFKNCTTQPSYGIIGYNPTHCKSHKEKEMIYRPLIKCSLCKTSKKKLATKTTGNKHYYCDNCAPFDAYDIHSICVICCLEIVNPDETICHSCNTYMIDKKTIKRKVKELSVKQQLDDNNIDIYLYDKIIPNGCSKKRPDFIIVCEWGYIVVEVDEFQHQRQTYSCECEITRMKQIFMDIGTQHVILLDIIQINIFLHTEMNLILRIG